MGVLRALPAAVALAAAALAVADARAGTVLTYDAGGKSVILWAQGTRLRIDSTAGPEPVTFLYDAAKGELVVMDIGARTVTEVPRAKAGSPRKRVRREMDEAIPGSSPEQKRVIDRMLRKMGLTADPASGGPRIKFRKLASGLPLGGLKTDRYQGHRAGKPACEAWVAGFDSLGVDAAPLRRFKDLRAFAPPAGRSAAAVGLTLASLSLWEKGVPVRVVLEDGAGPELTLELKDRFERDVEPQGFSIPPDYAPAGR